MRFGFVAFFLLCGRVYAEIVEHIPENCNATSCNSAVIGPENLRIVGGNQAGQGEWPWQGLLRTSTGGLCGCTLISPGWAVTAAHCTHELDHTNLYLTFGATDRSSNSNTQSLKVRRKIDHPDYDQETLANDISLLQLSSEVIENFYVRSISLPPQDADVTIGKECVITGWGTEHQSSTSNPTILREGIVPIISNAQCQSWLRIRIGDSLMCAGYEEGGVDTCQGDSGGPLVCYNDENRKYYLQGVTSFGFGCAAARKPGVYTRVSYYSDWISQNTGVAGSLSSNRSSLSTSILLSLIAYVLGCQLMDY